MKKYYYEVYMIPLASFAEPKLGGKFRGGVVVDIIGGIKDERLVVVGYEIVENEDDPR